MPEKNELFKKRDREDVATGTILGALCALLLWHFALVMPLENMVQDTYTRLAPAKVEKDELVMVVVDQDSVDWMTRFYDLTELGYQIFEKMNLWLDKSGARSIAYTFMPEGHVDGKDSGWENLRRKWRDSRVIKGFFLSSDVSQITKQNTLFNPLVNYRISIAGDARIPEYADAIVPPAPVNESYNYAGNIGLVPDPDGIFRHVHPVSIFGYRQFGREMYREAAPTLALAAWLADDPESTVHVGRGRIRIGDAFLPLDRQGRIRLRFFDQTPYAASGHALGERAVSARDVFVSLEMEKKGLVPTVAKDLFAGRHVLVDLRTGNTPVRTSALSADGSTAMLHAQVLLNILHGNALAESPYAIVPVLLYIFLTCMACLLLPRATGFALLAILLALPPVLGYGLFRNGLVLPVACYMASAVLGAMLTAGLRYFHEWQRRQNLQNTFNCYMNPVITERLLQNPELVELGGQEFLISMFFSDLQNFTSHSSRLEPRKTIDFLNDYLQEMSEIVINTGGCIDKYIGDAIVAFWNVPLLQADHADRAVRAAMRCQERITAMREDFEKRHGVKLAARVGIHTGRAVVGNVGSLQMRDYTAIGATVNLASRLEGANKYFKTNILISQATYESMNPDTADVLDLGNVQVVGESQATHLYAPYPRGTLQVREFNEAMQVFRSGDFAKALPMFSALESLPPSQVFATFCRKYLDEGNWQGQLVLTGK